MAKMLLHDHLANEFLYNFTENAEDITAEVRIIPETQMLFKKILKQECVLQKPCSKAAIRGDQ